MLEIVLFAFGVMYTPGPVNLLSLNSGTHKQFRRHLPFCLGVATALGCWFLLVGYTGSLLVNNAILPVIAGAGVGFILYLAYKVLVSKVDVSNTDTTTAVLTYKDGLLMQLLNPKAMMVVLPVTAIQFPAAGIDGAWIAIWSVGLSALGFGAPLTYAAFGAYAARHIQSNTYLKVMNVIMGIMLIAVALDMAYAHVYLALTAG